MKNILIFIVLMLNFYNLFCPDRCAKATITRQWRAEGICPEVCKEHGGWNGNWAMDGDRTCQVANSTCGCNG